MGLLFTGRPAGRPVDVLVSLEPRVLALAVEPRRDAATADRHPGERTRHALRLSRGNLDDAERFADLDLADGVFLETDLADQGTHEILRPRTILLPDVHEHLDSAGRRSGGRNAPSRGR